MESNADFCRMVAETFLWRDYDICINSFGWPCLTPKGTRDIWEYKPDEDAHDDYLVLEHVRKTWGIARLLRFSGMCDDQWNSRGVGTALQYHPGDYSRAALRALEQSNGT